MVDGTNQNIVWCFALICYLFSSPLSLKVTHTFEELELGEGGGGGGGGGGVY